MSMAYSLSNKYAKNPHKRTVLVQLIVKNVVTFFMQHSVVAGTTSAGELDDLRRCLGSIPATC